MLAKYGRHDDLAAVFSHERHARSCHVYTSLAACAALATKHLFAEFTHLCLSELYAITISNLPLV